MTLKLVAKYSKAFSNDKADCYIVDIGEDESVDFWFPGARSRPAWTSLLSLKEKTMGKVKLRPIAAIMRIINSVVDDDQEMLKADLRDLLRPEPKPKSKSKTTTTSRGSAQKRKAGEMKAACAICGGDPDNNIHQLATTPDYHEFQPTGEASKGVGA